MLAVCRPGDCPADVEQSFQQTFLSNFSPGRPLTEYEAQFAALQVQLLPTLISMDPAWVLQGGREAERKQTSGGSQRSNPARDRLVSPGSRLY